jgi:hypothetical protein
MRRYAGTNGLASSEAGLFFVFGEYSYVDEIGFQNNFEVSASITSGLVRLCRSGLLENCLWMVFCLGYLYIASVRLQFMFFASSSSRLSFYFQCFREDCKSRLQTGYPELQSFFVAGFTLS